MKITFHGAAQDVTGSQYLLEVNDRRLLLECGLYQGPREESYERNRKFLFDPLTLDAVILSHAHIDHSGNLPNLVKNGFGGPIFATQATARLADVLLRDSGRIQENDARQRNRNQKRDQRPRQQPIYTERDAEMVKSHFRPVEYLSTFEPLPGISARLIDAGHILGSAAVCLDISEPDRETYRFWFSGDIGRRDLAIIKDPVLPEHPDYLMMECTYGDTRHENDPEEAIDLFLDVVQRTIKRRGKVIIPAFAVGRTQELVYALNQFIQADKIESVPIYVDSPLAIEASHAYHNSQRFYDQETQDFMDEENLAPLVFKEVTYVSSAKDSSAIQRRRGPMVVLSASGMAETGRIVHHIKAGIGDPRNTIAIVSYQAPNTLGWRLLQQPQEIEIQGEIFPVRAEIVKIDGLSAHAGQRMLLEYATHNNGNTRKIILVHGEPDAATIFRQKLNEILPAEVLYPNLHESIEI